MAHPWLTEHELGAWRDYIESSAALSNALEADLQSHGLTLGDYEVLVRLSDVDEQMMRMCDLAGQLRLSPSGLTRRLDGLVKAKFVERVSCSADRRVAYAHLTKAGMAKLQKAAPDHAAGVRRHLIDVLTPEQVSQLGTIFATLREHLESLQPA